MRRFRFLLGAVVLALVAMAIAGVVATEGLLHPQRRELSPHVRERAAQVAESFGARLEDAQISAADGVTLRGWFFRAQESSGNAVILLHGVTDNRSGVLGLVQPFLARQYDVLAIDSRAHGASGGAIATYGLKEADDVNRWAAWLATEHGARRVFGLGESMGAGILLQALRRETRFTAVAAESPFSTFREVAYDRIAAQIGCGGWVGRMLLRPVVESGFWYARLRYGVNLDQSSPVAAAASTRVPILLIHGAEDRNIRPEHSLRILGRSRGRMERWVAPQAGHTGVFARWPTEFMRRVVLWFSEAPLSPAAHSLQ